ncbi:MAG: DUF4296 domain-containing protein [Psychroflexus sp.]
MKKCLIIFFSLGILCACQDIEQPKKPKHLLSKKQMKDLLYDMILLDATTGVNNRKLQELDIEMYDFLTKKYNIDSATLSQNIDYYNYEFETNLDIYESVKDSIEILKTHYDSIQNLKDSIRKLEGKKLDSLKLEDPEAYKRSIKLKIKD